MGFYHVGQADLKPLTSPAWASQSAGITGVSHCALPVFMFVPGNRSASSASLASALSPIAFPYYSFRWGLISAHLDLALCSMPPLSASLLSMSQGAAGAALTVFPCLQASASFYYPTE